MDFRKKLKIRLYSAIVMIVLGIIMIAAGSDMVSSLGLAFIILSIVRIRNYFIITKSEDSIRSREIAETDERNIMLMQKSRSLAFSIYFFLVCIAEIILSMLKMTKQAQLLGYILCLMLLIYWVIYFIMRRKN